VIHTPVLLNEAIEALQVKLGGQYVDCTVGEGGHATAVLEHGGRVLGIDTDPQAIKHARATLLPYGKKAILINEDFTNLADICSRLGFEPVSGILFDLGMSSFQLADAKRGFSFQHEAPLNMCFNPSQEFTAATIVNTFPEDELAATVVRAVGKRGRIHPATRTFQALRIAVNRELERLKVALKQALHVLEVGGRLVVITFHSLEDRLVKDFFRRESQDCLCPPRTPVCICGHHATLKLIVKGVVAPSRSEIQANPRSRSAKMRVAERI